MPRVSVILSTYNGERFVAKTIGSILGQTFRDFELIVLNDASTDNTERVLAQIDDPRLRLVANESNLGIAASQNRAVSFARGELIALSDHDDLSDPRRLEEQVRFLDSHHDVALVGSGCKVIGEDGADVGEWGVPYEDIDIKWGAVTYDPFIHTSVMLRRATFEAVGGYAVDSNYQFAEDYEFLSRVAFAFPVANLRTPLVSHRLHDNQASRLNQNKQRQSITNIAQRNMKIVLAVDSLTPGDYSALEKLMRSDALAPIDISTEQVRRAVSLLHNLRRSFYPRFNFPENVFKAHSRSQLRILGKHLLALSYRRNGKRSVSCRLNLLKMGTMSVFQCLRRSPDRVRGVAGAACVTPPRLVSPD